MTKKYVDVKDCQSTHGGSGYAFGSYWDNGAVICGWCGFRIENPRPTCIDDSSGHVYFGQGIRVSRKELVEKG